MKAPRTAPTAADVAPRERRRRRVQISSKINAAAPLRKKARRRRSRPVCPRGETEDD
jgi:hypothetical protein